MRRGVFASLRLANSARGSHGAHASGNTAGLTSGPKTGHKENFRRTSGNAASAAIAHEARTHGIADPDRGARRRRGAVLRERGRRGGRRLARRRAGSGAGTCGRRPGRYRLRLGAVRAAARAGPVVRGRGQRLSSPSSARLGRTRVRSAPAGDGAGGRRGGGARGGRDGAPRTGACGRGGRGGSGAGRGGGAPASARGRDGRRAGARTPGAAPRHGLGGDRVGSGSRTRGRKGAPVAVDAPAGAPDETA